MTDKTKTEAEKPDPAMGLTLWVQVKVAANTFPAIHEAIDVARRVVDAIDDQPHEAWPNGEPVVITGDSDEVLGEGAVLYMPKIHGAGE